MKKIILWSLFGIFSIVGPTMTAKAGPGDTTIVQTFTFDSTMRKGVFVFPSDTTKTYEKIIMLYSMRCKDGNISTGSNTNIGCGEWDYNCYTYIVDSLQTDSVKATGNSHVISNQSGVTTFNYTASPVYNYYQSTQQDVVYNSTVSETVYPVGTAGGTVGFPLGAASPVSRAQLLFRASELTAAGMTADSISGLKLDISALGSALSNLKIRMKLTSQTDLDPDNPDLAGFTEAYYVNTTVSNTGPKDFNLYAPFYWDGSSNILVEFTYNNNAPGTDNIVDSDTPGFNGAIYSNTPDNYVTFDNNTSIIELNNNFYGNISNEITIAFWAYGNPAKLPANTIMMEAYDQDNKRQVNIHLPWNDSNIYWDCGNDGAGYDRINKLGLTNEIEGQWNFWTFTKNAASGSMKIYLNGQLWHSGTGKSKPININRFVVGKGVTAAAAYYGNFDELSIWNKELSQATVQQIMNHDITAANPDYAFLQVYHQFNDNAGNAAVDNSPNGNDGYFTNPTRVPFNGNTLFRNFNSSTDRPRVSFVVGQYTKTITPTTVLDSSLVPATSIVSYGLSSSNHSLDPIDTIYVWPSGYAYIYDQAGTVVDSISVASQNTVNVSLLNYYSARPMYMELINFITPYGINLNLDGLNGKTWAFDVTDFAPLLKGQRHMEMKDGIYQEDNDIKFVFYEGTPPRDVKAIQQVWPSGAWTMASYNDIVNDKYFEPRNIDLDPNATMYKVRSAISGHGQDGEFVPRTHTITLNGVVPFSRQVWTECADNPIYPQGGTWIYDRAGWCPGAAVDLKEYEITNYVTPGQSISLDYSLPSNPNPGQSNYRVNNQLVTYGAPNFTMDAAVDYIKAPSSRVEFQRFNSVCNNPVVAIKNTGSTIITSLDITYGRVGGTMSTYTWTGTLKFLASALVTLPQPAWLSSGSNQFVVYVSNPNGSADQYAFNDTMYSEVVIPSQLPSDLFFELKTNNFGSDNAYTLKDSQGNIVISRSGLANNTIYRDTVSLASDCYTLYLTDANDNGLSFWAQPSAGTGYFRIRQVSNGATVQSFNADFGDNIYQQFTVGFTLPVPEVNVPIKQFTVFPNPANDAITAQIAMQVNSQVELKLMNLLGEAVLTDNLVMHTEKENYIMDVSNVKAGVYYLVASCGTYREVQKVVITR